MPKKFTSNTKVQKGNEIKLKNKLNKQHQEAEQKEQKQQQLWKDDTKKSQREEHRRQKQELELLKKEKKSELNKQLEAEQLQFSKAKLKSTTSTTLITKQKYDFIKPTTQNKDTKIPQYGASNIDDAIKLLSIANSTDTNDHDSNANPSLSFIKLDKHPEKRQKQKFQLYEERRIQELKEEYPHLRLSQLKQRIFKEWQKSSENPFNQNTVISYDTSKQDLQQIKQDIKQDIENELRIE